MRVFLVFASSSRSQAMMTYKRQQADSLRLWIVVKSSDATVLPSPIRVGHRLTRLTTSTDKWRFCSTGIKGISKSASQLWHGWECRNWLRLVLQNNQARLQGDSKAGSGLGLKVVLQVSSFPIPLLALEPSWSGLMGNLSRSSCAVVIELDKRTWSPIIGCRHHQAISALFQQ